MTDQSNETGAVDTVTPDATPEQAEAKLNLTVAIEDSGPARKKLTIEVDADEIKSKTEENYSTLQEEAVLPGFRKGRAPRRLIERRFASSLKEDVKTQLISTAYQQVIEDEKLDVLSQPRFIDGEKIDLPEEGNFKFEVEVEVVPDFEMPELEGVEVKKPKVEVSDAEIDAELGKMCEQYGELKSVNEAVQVKDYVQAFVRILAGENAGDDADQIAEHPSTYILVNGEEMDFKGHVVGILVSDLGKQLAGKNVGDELRISQTGPAGHEDERIKDKPITLVIRIDQVQRVVPAELSVLAEQFGAEGEEAFREQFKQMAEQRRRGEAQQEMRNQVGDWLLEQVPMDLPEGLSQQQTLRVLQNQYSQMAMAGVPEQEIQQRIAELRAQSEDIAARQLKLLFVLDRIADKYEVEVGEGEINGQIVQMAHQQGRRPEKLKQEMAKSGQLDQIWVSLRQSKALDKIIEQAKVEDVDQTPREMREAARAALAGDAGKKVSKKSSKKAEADDAAEESAES